jgi:hypothetical protein
VLFADTELALVAYSLGIAAGAWAWSKCVYRVKESILGFEGAHLLALQASATGVHLKKVTQCLRRQLVIQFPSHPSHQVPGIVSKGRCQDVLIVMLEAKT